MTLRQKLACVGLTVFGLQIASAAALELLVKKFLLTFRYILSMICL